MEQVFVIIFSQPQDAVHISCKHFSAVHFFGHFFQDDNNMFIQQHPKIDKVF